MWHRTTFPGDWWGWSRHGSVPTSSPERQQLNLNDGIASGAPPRFLAGGARGAAAAAAWLHGYTLQRTRLAKMAAAYQGRSASHQVLSCFRPNPTTEAPNFELMHSSGNRKQGTHWTLTLTSNGKRRHRFDRLEMMP